MLDGVEYVPWRTLGVALVHTGLGEKDEAFQALERAIELRADARFQKLLRQMNFPQ